MSFSTSLHKLLVDNLTTATILLDDQLQIEYINPAAEVMLSTSLQRCHKLPMVEIVTERTDSITLQQALGKKQPCTKHDAYLIVNNNHEVMADYVITPIIEESCCYFLVEFVLLDTPRIPKEEMLASQQEANKLLIRGLAHEIKNPLGGIRGTAQLLERALTDQSFIEYTNILIEETDRLCNLVDRMLGSNKLPNYQTTNIHEILERVSSLIKAESQSKIIVIKDYDPSIPEISIDAEQMIQAILNIARNALEALISQTKEQPQITFRTRIYRQFTIGTTRHKLVINIDIMDNGPGIPSHLKDTLFYPMVSGRPEGTGLGLAITQNIIMRHGGTIEYTSQPSNTKFSIFLPLESGIDAHE